MTDLAREDRQLRHMDRWLLVGALAFLPLVWVGGYATAQYVEREFFFPTTVEFRDVRVDSGRVYFQPVFNKTRDADLVGMYGFVRSGDLRYQSPMFRANGDQITGDKDRAVGQFKPESSEWYVTIPVPLRGGEGAPEFGMTLVYDGLTRISKQFDCDCAQ